MNGTPFGKFHGIHSFHQCWSAGPNLCLKFFFSYSETHQLEKNASQTYLQRFFKWFLPESQAVDELEEMHMKVLSEMTDETTKSVGTVEVRGECGTSIWSKSGRIHALLKTERMSSKKGLFQWGIHLPTSNHLFSGGHWHVSLRGGYHTCPTWSFGYPR